MATAYRAQPEMQFNPSKLEISDGLPDMELDMANALGIGIQVEDFWGDYVDNLGAQAQDEFDDGSGEYGTSLHAFNPAAFNGSSGMAAVDPMTIEVPVLPATGSVDEPQPKGRIVTTGLDLPAQNAQLPGFQNRMPHIPSTSQNSAYYGSGALPLGGGPHLGSNGSENGQHSPHMDEDEPEGQSGRSRAAARNRTGPTKETKTKRNAKQQIQNKQAQQRYRERRKERFGQMEAALEELNEQVKEMTNVQAQNSMLQGKTSELERVLREKEEEIERLKAKLTSASDAAQQGGVIDEAPEEARSAVREADLKRFAASREVHIQKLREFIDRHGLRNVNPTGDGVPDAIVKELATLVSAGCIECQKAMRAEGIQVLELMSRSVGQVTRISCQKKREKWVGLLEMLRLTPQQQEQLMSVRKMHLQRLRSTYEERQALNMQAMSLMLPPPPQARPEAQLADDDGAVDRKLACMSLNDYSRCARNHVDLNTVLDKIKVNLRLEQKNVLEMSFMVMGRILSSIQAAIFLVEVYPWHVDALALTNVLAHSLNREDSGGVFGSRTLSGDEKSSDSSEGCPFAEPSPSADSI
ncbi:hypothetical protein WJX72_007643 [[Myrmecia] bisecta]|uniref:BZIP domain-containing protein n=1 Tax=[Myrmecia] bisecta TaxID=41462 RepID=A0AAW1QS67_9CHLO